jgi:DNA-binding transcriptional regulator YiaG
MTPSDLKAARHALGLSAQRFASLLRVADGRTVRRWEAGDSDIPGPVIVILDLLQNCPQARKRLGL